MTNDRNLRPRRFSEGMELDPSLPSSARVGSFADGIATMRDARIGSFADGQALVPDARASRRVGTFADTYVPPVETVRSRPRLGGPRVRPRPQAA